MIYYLLGFIQALFRCVPGWFIRDVFESNSRFEWFELKHEWKHRILFVNFKFKFKHENQMRLYVVRIAAMLSESKVESNMRSNVQPNVPMNVQSNVRSNVQANVPSNVRFNIVCSGPWVRSNWCIAWSCHLSTWCIARCNGIIVVRKTPHAQRPSIDSIYFFFIRLARIYSTNG